MTTRYIYGLVLATAISIGAGSSRAEICDAPSPCRWDAARNLCVHATLGARNDECRARGRQTCEIRLGEDLSGDTSQFCDRLFDPLFGG